MSEKKVALNEMTREQFLKEIVANRKSEEMVFSNHKKVLSACPHRHLTGALSVNPIDSHLMNGENNWVQCTYCGEKFRFKKYNDIELTKLEDELNNVVQYYKTIDSKATIGTHAQVGLSKLVLSNIIRHLITHRRQIEANELKKKNGNGKQKRNGNGTRGVSGDILSALLSGGQQANKNKHGYHR